MAPILVTGRDDRVTKRQKQHAEEKLRKLARYFDAIQKTEAVLSHGSTHGAGEAEVEVVISVKGGKPLVCQARSKELYAAIDLALDKAEAQLTRLKGRVKNRKAVPREAAAELAAPVPGEEGPEEEGYQDIVEKRDFS